MLRCSFFIILAIFPVVTLRAQYGTGTQALMGNKRSDVAYRCPRLYAGLTTGINSPVGLIGAQVDIPITQRVSVCPGFGFGTWGWKGSLEGRYFFDFCNRGFALSLGGAYAAGGTELIVYDVPTPNGRETISYFQRPAFNALISACYFAGIGRQGHRLHFQAGYALPLNDDRLQQTGGTPGTPPTDLTLELRPPGGPIVSAGVSFGIGRFRQ